MKILVAGCGSIGKRHAVNAARLAELGVFDPSEEAREACVQATGGRPFADLDQALAWGPDAVVVATPTFLHLDVATRAVDAGAHVLVEKPLSHSLEGVSDFLDRAEAVGRRVHVVCNMRFHPAVESVRRGMADIGTPLYARAHYGNHLPSMRPGVDYRKVYSARKDMGGGVIFDAIHEIDYLTLILGTVDSVQAHTATIGELGIDVEDFASLCMLHGGGARSLIQLDFLRRAKRRGCEIVGTEGTVLWQSEGKSPHHCLVRSFNVVRGTWATHLDEDDLDDSLSHAAMMERYVRALEEGKDWDLLTGRQAAGVLATALAAHRSSAGNGCAVSCGALEADAAKRGAQAYDD